MSRFGRRFEQWTEPALYPEQAIAAAYWAGEHNDGAHDLVPQDSCVQCDAAHLALVEQNQAECVFALWEA